MMIAVLHMTTPEIRSTPLSTMLDIIDSELERIATGSLATNRNWGKIANVHVLLFKMHIICC